MSISPIHPSLRLLPCGYVAAVMMLLSICSGMAQAAITCSTQGSMTVTLPASISAPRDRSAGTLLTGWLGASGLMENGCSASDTSTTYLQAKVTLAATGKRVTIDGRNHPIFRTSLSGVGLAMSAKDNNGSWYAVEATPTDLIKGWSTYWNANVAVMLVATGEPIANGTVSAVKIGEFMIAEKSSGTTSTPAPIMITSTTATAQTCSVEAGSVNIAVDLATTSSSKLAGAVGATDGSASFNVRLNCSTGMNVYMTLSDANNLGNTSDTLTLSPSPVQARGVGIQVRRNGTPVRLGPDSSVAGNTNQIALGASPNGVLNIPFTANYIKTEATVRPGEANAVATYTLSYQ